MVSSKKKVLSAFLSLAMIGSMVAAVPLTASAAETTTTATPGVSYSVHQQTYSWEAAVTSGLAGVTGQSKRLEAVKINLTGAPTGASITYQVHQQTYSWETPVSDGAQAGKTGESKRLEAIKITLNGMPGYEVEYRVHQQTYATENWVTVANGTAIAKAGIAGVTGQSKRLEALEVKVEKTADEVAAETAATAAVVKAETSKLQADIDAATIAVKAVQDVATNKALTDRINAISAKLQVSSVVMLNAKQLQVTFTQPVSKTDAETISKYAVNSTALTGSAALQSDNKTVIITLAPGEVQSNGTTFTFTANPISSSTDATVQTTSYATILTEADTTAPTVTSATSKTSGSTATSVTVTYSEPVASGVVKIDNTGFQVTPGATTDTFTGLSLDATKSHTLEYVNLTDYAKTTANVTPDATMTFGVTQDTVVPVISSVAQYSNSSVLVTFSKAMTVSTVTGATVKAADAALTSYTVGTITALPGDTTNTKFIVPLTLSYASVSSYSLSLAFPNTIKDSLGNALTAVSIPVTLVKDTVAPVVTGITVEKLSTGAIKDIVVNYNKPLGSSTPDSSKITLIDNQGVMQTTATYLGTATAVTAGDTSVTIPVTATFNSTATGTWTATIPASFVTDVNGNTSTAYTGTFDATQSTAPTAPFTLTTGSASILKDVITVSYGTAVKGGAVTGSATSGYNYSLDGKTLEGATIYLSTDRKTATIVLASNTIPTSLAYATFRIQNVQNDAGTVITPYTQTVSITDNTVPTIAITTNSKTVLKVTASEALSTGGTAYTTSAFGDYTGTAKGVSALVSAIYNAADNSITFTFDGTQADGATIILGATPAITDGAGNALATKTLTYSASTGTWTIA